jgi:phosphohistidine phosphatase
LQGEIMASMSVYLLRHGEAVADNVDPSRPLTRRGRDQVERVCRAAAERGLEVSEIMHSEKLRARETAEILAQCAAPSAGLREITGLDPQADPIIAKAEIEARDEPVALVGHMPHLGRLAALLLTGEPDREPQSLATASLLHLKKDGKWKIAETIEPDAGCE